jgi:uncharacterized protein DUF4326
MPIPLIVYEPAVPPDGAIKQMGCDEVDHKPDEPRVALYDASRPGLRFGVASRLGECALETRPDRKVHERPHENAAERTEASILVCGTATAEENTQSLGSAFRLHIAPVDLARGAGTTGDGKLRFLWVPSAIKELNWSILRLPKSEGGDELEGASTPQRIQLQRTKGWRMPPNGRKVDRSTRYGNPFEAARCEPEEARRLYRAWLSGEMTDEVIEGRYPSLVARHLISRRHFVLASLTELRGMNLACWCAPSQACHADLLLELANRDEHGLDPRAVA